MDFSKISLAKEFARAYCVVAIVNKLRYINKLLLCAISKLTHSADSALRFRWWILRLHGLRNVVGLRSHAVDCDLDIIVVWQLWRCHCWHLNCLSPSVTVLRTIMWASSEKAFDRQRLDRRIKSRMFRCHLSCLNEIADQRRHATYIITSRIISVYVSVRY